MRTIENAIGGALARSTSPRTAPIFNPATGEQSAILPLSTSAELDAAVAAAKLAFPGLGRHAADAPREVHVPLQAAS